MFIALYRNDLLIFNKDPQALKVVKEQLFAKFMKDLGEVSYCLGIHTMRNMRLKTISLSQTTYIENILKCFSMETCKLVNTPLDINTTFIKHVRLVDQKKPREMAKIPYKQAVSNIMYVMIVIRPDIAIDEYSELMYARS